MWIAERDEAPEVARLLGLFRDWFGRSDPADDLLLDSVAQLMDRGEAEYLLGAPRAGERAAGVCQLRYRFGVWYGAPDCGLEDLFVSEEARGSGLGRAMLEKAIERARERGCRRMELDTNEENKPARALYERHGFSSRSSGTEGRDLLMRLHL